MTRNERLKIACEKMAVLEAEGVQVEHFSVKGDGEATQDFDLSIDIIDPRTTILDTQIVRTGSVPHDCTLLRLEYDLND